MQKLDLNLLFRKKESKLIFVSSLILTFRLNMDSVMELFDCEDVFDTSDIREVYEKIIRSNYDRDKSFNYCLIHEQCDQELAKRNCKKYFDLFNIALIGKNKQRIAEYQAILRDDDYLAVQNKYYYDMTDEEFLCVVKFQLKYSLTCQKMVDDNRNSASSYSQKAKRILKDKPELLERFINLEEYYYNIFKSNRRRGNQR